VKKPSSSQIGIIAAATFVTTLLTQGVSLAALTLYDDFSNATVSDTLWEKTVAGDGSITFDGATATIDMSAKTLGKVAEMSATNAGMQLGADGDFFRMTWDITVIDDDKFSFYGARIGDPSQTSDDMTWTAVRNRSNGGVTRIRARSNSTNTGSLNGNVNNLVNVADPRDLHFDFTITRVGAGSGADAKVKVYDRVFALDVNPAGYSGETPLETLSISGGIMTAGELEPVNLFVRDVFAQPDTFTQNRGAAVFDNVYIENNALGGGILGDFDNDADVDGADFLVWQRDLGDAGNLADWEGNFGTTSPLVAISAVPEPSALVLLGLAGVIGLLTRRDTRA